MIKPVKKIPNPSDCSKEKQPYLYFTDTSPSFELFFNQLPDKTYKATIAGRPDLFAINADPDKALSEAQAKLIKTMAASIS